MHFKMPFITKKSLAIFCLLTCLGLPLTAQTKDVQTPVAKPKSTVAPTAAAKVERTKDGLMTLMVIVNEDSQIKEISMSELRDIYTGDLMYLGKLKISSYLSSEAELNDAILRKVYQLRNKRLLKKMWMKKVYRGVVFSRPTTLSEAKAVVKSVSEEPGAIGIIPYGKVPKGVKVVPVDKKSKF